MIQSNLDRLSTKSGKLKQVYLLRKQGNTFKEIGIMMNFSGSRAFQLYRKAEIRLRRKLEEGRDYSFSNIMQPKALGIAEFK